ncbi:MAG: hypothetical protein WEB30_14705 [Cyclobacteriaceae bacterium]
MRTILFLSVALTLLALQSCQRDNRESAQKKNEQRPPVKHETPEKMIEELVGEWQHAGTGNDTRDTANQTLTFTEEARYIVREGGRKTDSGAYRMNEQLRNIYLESEANESPLEYEVQLNGDTLILSSKEPSQGEAEQVYVKRN